MEVRHADHFERVERILAVRDSSRMAQAFLKLKGSAEVWNPQAVLQCVVEELISELTQSRVIFTVMEAEQLSDAIHRKISQDQVHEFFGISKLEEEIRINVFRHLVYAHRSQDMGLTPSERYRKKIVEGVAAGEAPQDTEQEFMEFYWAHGPERARTARSIERGDSDRPDFILRQEAGIWLQVPAEISDDVALATPLLTEALQWNKVFRDPRNFYNEVQSRIAMWALESFRSKEEFFMDAANFQNYCLQRLQTIYEPLLMNETYLKVYRENLMEEADKGLALDEPKDVLKHLIEKVYAEHFKHAEIQNALPATISKEAKAELADLIPGLFDGETPLGSPRIDTTEPDKS
ncbi:MAG: hypothetical protein AAB802_00040 [Patescibacteria group bacterium]